jgi:hypothetical protein
MLHGTENVTYVYFSEQELNTAKLVKFLKVRIVNLKPCFCRVLDLFFL